MPRRDLRCPGEVELAEMATLPPRAQQAACARRGHHPCLGSRPLCPRFITSDIIDMMTSTAKTRRRECRDTTHSGANGTERTERRTAMVTELPSGLSDVGAALLAALGLALAWRGLRLCRAALPRPRSASMQPLTWMRGFRLT